MKKADNGKELIDFDIEEIFKEELEKETIDHYQSQEYQIQESRNNLIIEKITNSFINAYKKKDKVDIFGALKSTLLRADLDYETLNRIFGRIEELLNQENRESLDSETKEPNIVEILRIASKMFWRKQLYTDLEKIPLSRQLVLLKKVLLGADIHKTPVFYEMILRIQADVKQEIEFKKEEIIYEQQLNLIEDSQQETLKKDNSEFTTTRQVLALRYLLQFVKAKDRKRNAQKKFIYFLTNKDLSSIGKKFDDDGLAYSKDGEDLSFVREQFANLGLIEIVRMIDNDTP